MQKHTYIHTIYIYTYIHIYTRIRVSPFTRVGPFNERQGFGAEAPKPWRRSNTRRKTSPQILLRTDITNNTRVRQHFAQLRNIACAAGGVLLRISLGSLGGGRLGWLRLIEHGERRLRIAYRGP